MKVFLHGKNSADIEPLVKKLGFDVVSEKPDVIISYGGDGTLLASERKYPGIPKLPIRNSQVCKKCSEHGEKTLLKKLFEGKLELKEYKKLQTNIHGKDIFAINDFVIRNEEPMHAIRFKILTPSPSELFIGDGVVISTPFGSSGYYKSVTKKTFNEGFSLALNNTTADKDASWSVNQDDKVGFQLVRGKGILSFDNSPETFHISEGTTLEFKLSEAVAKIYELESLRCPNCIVKRG